MTDWMYLVTSKPHIFAILLLSALSLTDCAEVPVSSDIASVNYGLGSNSSPSHAVRAQVQTPQPTPELEALWCQVNDKSGFVASDGSSPRLDSEETKILVNPMRAELASTDFMHHYVNALMQKTADPDDASPITVEPGELKDFAEVFGKTFLKMLADIQTNSTGDNTSRSLDNILVAYYKAYFDGKYVTRDGTTLAKPTSNMSFTNAGKLDFSGNISTNTLNGFLTVFLEAVHDFALDMPDYYDSDNSTYFDGTKSDPTSVTLKVIKQVKLGADGNITASNWRPVHYLVSGSATGSKILTSMAVKGLGGAGVGPLFGFAKFSVGDNTSLTTMIETWIDIAMVRDGEWLAYEKLKAGSRSAVPAGAYAPAYAVTGPLTNSQSEDFKKPPELAGDRWRR